MIVKWNNNIVDYKCKVFFFFFKTLQIHPFFYFFLVYVLKKKKKKRHQVGLEPGFPVREAGALTRNAKGYSL